MADSAALLAHYRELTSSAPFDFESCTLLMVPGAAIGEVTERLGGVPVDDVPEGDFFPDKSEWTTYSLETVAGGVLASESTGYADPPNAVLVALSQSGRSVAVVRNNVQGHTRFGCARDGVLLFDDDEYRYIGDLDAVPDELRDLFELAWTELGEDGLESVEPFDVIALAMAEVFTGLRVTSDALARLSASSAQTTAVRMLQYKMD